MADLYSVLSVIPETELIPPNRIRTVHEMTLRAKPSGVIFYYRAAPVDFNPAHLELILPEIAEVVNRAAAVPGVESLSVEQDLTPENFLDNKWLAVVASSSGDSLAEVRAPYGAIFDQTFAKKVAAARANLDALEKL